jgi:GT2 family glycosyltransferase
MIAAAIDPERPFVSGPCSLRVQTVLFETQPSDLERSLASIDRAAEIALAEGAVSSVEVAYGDSSPMPVLGDEQLEAFNEAFPSLAGISYSFFASNMGSAGGQNRLLEDARTDLVFFINPDVRLGPTSLAELIKPFRAAGVGATEARQLPLEHPKDYDPTTGETGWAAGACMMVPLALAKAVGGFDAASFFLYCDDVDLSWRIRLAGLKIIHQPSAGIFHDKRLTIDGTLLHEATQRYYSAEAALLMAHKYGRPDLVRRMMADYEASGEAHLRRAADAYRARKDAGRLPPVTPAPGIADFAGSNFTRHRFPL